MRFSKRKRGFSLFELLFVLALCSLLCGFLWPSWKSFFTQVRNQDLLSRLERVLRFVRQEAVLRGQKMTLCASQDQRHCSENWKEGLLVLSEEGGFEQHLIRVFQFSPSEGELHFRAFPRHQQTCEFLPSGETNHENGTFWYCEGTQALWALLLSQSGQWRIVYARQNKQLRDERGQPLLCE